MDRHLPFDRYMEYSLYNEKTGYYIKKEKIFGKRGDFYTPQTVSSLFGNVLAKIIKEESFKKVYEFGAGYGDLAFDILSSNSKIKDYIIFEISENMINRARNRLIDFREKIRFYKKIEEILEMDGFVIMVEFVDAFPVKRFFKKSGKFYEVWVDVYKKKEILKKGVNYEFLKYYKFLPDGYYFEFPFSFIKWFEKFSEKFKRGKVLIIDYGIERENLVSYPEGTIRGFKEHRVINNILEFPPGEIDITYTPDFSLLRDIFEEKRFKIERFCSLSKFLIEKGILEIFEREISQKGTLSFKIKKQSELKTLITPGLMGEKYLVMEIKR